MVKNFYFMWDSGFNVCLFIYICIFAVRHPPSSSDISVAVKGLIKVKVFISTSLCLSLNQGLLLEQQRLMSDYDKLKAEEQEKDAKLQRLT